MVPAGVCVDTAGSERIAAALPPLATAWLVTSRAMVLGAKLHAGDAAARQPGIATIGGQRSFGTTQDAKLARIIPIALRADEFAVVPVLQVVPRTRRPGHKAGTATARPRPIRGLRRR